MNNKEKLNEGILLRSAGSFQEKLSWAQTAEAMTVSREDWSEWDGTFSDGLESLPWPDTKK